MNVANAKRLKELEAECNAHFKWPLVAAWLMNQMICSSQNPLSSISAVLLFDGLPGI
jgi:hypothetical protein